MKNNINFNIEEVSFDTWKNAQKAELDCWMHEPQDNEDWNSWWASKFLNYSFLQKEEFIESIYEVGCGPYAKNIELVCRTLDHIPERFILEDPLLDEYIKLNKSVKRFLQYPNSKMISKPMEKFKFSDLNIEPVNLVICNNVLDHVQSVEACFDHIFSSLKDDGILIFGQDLTSSEDVENHKGLVDPCHPIRIDEMVLEKYLSKYNIILKKILPRDEGRNPEYHYATMIFAGRKINV
jgi:hypothetical protein